MLNNEQILLIISILFFLISLVFYLRYIKVFKQNKELSNEFLALVKDNEFLSENLKNLNQELGFCKNEINTKIAENQSLSNELSRINEELKNTKEKLENESEIKNDLKVNLDEITNKFHTEFSKNEALSEKIKLYENSLKSLETKYENMLKTLEENLKEQNEKSSKLIYEENTKLLLTNSNELLTKIFSPLKEQISEYEKTLLKQNTSIENNIKTMFETSQNLGKKADEFANLLKGDKKARGDFGEIMLKQCLLASGLRENEHFYLQESFKDEENKLKKPDAIVYFEPKKCVIIDAKFSLPNEIDSPNFKDEIAKNLNNRINELSSKKYEQSVEFANEYILLFVPYQNILDLALEADKNIFIKAESKKIFLVSPTTLFMGLKMIFLGWQNYEINQNVAKIITATSNFYDKFAALFDDYEKLKEQMDKNFAKLDIHFYGKGNIKNRLENLQTLGIKYSKTLPEANLKTLQNINFIKEEK